MGLVKPEIGGVNIIFINLYQLGFQAVRWIISPVKYPSLISSFSHNYFTRIIQTKLMPELIGAWVVSSASATISNYQYEKGVNNEYN